MNQPQDAASADRLGRRIAALLEAGGLIPAYDLLAPLLSRRVPFRLLDRVGAQIGKSPASAAATFLEQIASRGAMGAWPLLGSALAAQYPRSPENALRRCRRWIIAADVWHAADTLAERVPGAALVTDFANALRILAGWRVDANRWVRKSAGVAVHLWTKRSRGEARHLSKAKRLLAFLQPMFFEQDLDAVKGIGWALKTMGRYYPAAAAPWLERQVVRQPGFRPLMLRKALTYLPARDRRRILKAAGR